MQINHRQISIIYELLNSQNPVSAADIGARLDISGRVVYFNLSAIRKWLLEENATLVIKPREGIHIEVSEETRKRLFEKFPRSPNGPVSLASKYRQLWIALLSLAHDYPLNTHCFRSQLNISENTLSRDCEQVKRKLAIYGVKLDRARGVGTFLVAPEINIRHALVALLVEILGETTIVNLCLWRKSKLMNPWSELGLLRGMSLRILENWAPWDSWRLSSQVLSILGCRCAEADHVQIALYLAIAFMRGRNGHHVDVPQEQLESIHNSKVFTLLKEKLGRFISTHHIEFPDNEIAQLSFQVAAHVGIDLWGNREDIDEADTENGYFTIANRILNDVYSALGMQFSESSVTGKLAAHLQRYMARVRYGVHTNNRFLEDVRGSYPELFQVVQEVTASLQGFLGGPLPEEEMAFITMYAEMAIQLHRSQQQSRRPRVIVVCPTGGITASMLMFRLRSELPDIDAIEVVSIRDLNRQYLVDIDAIITTAHSLSHKDVPVISVHPLLGVDDVARVRAVLYPT
jgi:transcriptional antiterminator